MKLNEPEQQKLETEYHGVAEECEAIFQATAASRSRTFDNAEISTERTLTSASAIFHRWRATERRQTDRLAHR